MRAGKVCGMLLTAIDVDSLKCHTQLYRVDIHDNTLIVGYPTSPGHEIMADLFCLLARVGRSYPIGEY
jgi:hypothetical protein